MKTTNTLIIADACANHLGNRLLIETMIQKASQAKVDIIKFQAFEASRLNKQFPDYEANLRYYQQVELKYDDYYFIKRCADINGIEPLFTIFNKELIPIVHDITPNRVKIASPDADNYPLIEECLKQFKEVIVSTGMITPTQLRKLRQYPVKTMYCVSKYPTLEQDIDFSQMIHHDGFSDHTLSTISAKKAIDLDLAYIEKHFTLGRDLYGRDQAMSSTSDQFKELVDYRDYKNKIQVYKQRWTNVK